MESIFGIPVKYSYIDHMWHGHNNDVAIDLYMENKFYVFHVTWKAPPCFVECIATTKSEVISKMRKKLVKTGHRVFGGKS